jgi:hypothetical protein
MKGWIRAQASFHCVNKEWDLWNMAQFIIEFRKDGQSVKSKLIRLHRMLSDGQTKIIFIDSKVPEVEFDQVMVAVYNLESRQVLQVDDLKVFSIR